MIEALNLEGEFYLDKKTRILYATDASAYREIPAAVAIPTTVEDVRKLVLYARDKKLSLIPRAAGTSLAGQVVGGGIVVDVSRHLNRIVEIDKEKSLVSVQPGVIRDELNLALKDYGLFFGPETSTANRAMIGGMVGNNACGSNSLVYGSARDHVVSIKAILCDGSDAIFGPLSLAEFKDKLKGDSFESSIYRNMYELLSDASLREEIFRRYPKKSIKRRNTGYALDLLLDCDLFGYSEVPFNFCKLLAGSEGSLAFMTEIKLHVNETPLVHRRLVCAHFHSMEETFRANLIALKYKPEAVELMDQYIIKAARANIEQRRNSFFIMGDPAALLAIELAGRSADEAERRAKLLLEELKSVGLGYHFPVLMEEEAKRVWSLRKAGLGLLSNMPGDAKPVPLVEDTAVDVNDLGDYIAEFDALLEKYGLRSVHYAHAGSGELHLRPILNLKTEEGVRLYRVILEEVAALVRKYRGSLSGEHGDGRLRGEFIPFMIGDRNYEALRKVKQIWDPHGIFNPGKIVDTPPMNQSLRYDLGRPTPQYNTVLDFSSSLGIVRAAEFCNGSGDCRKTHLSGGIMCPSYMATKNEKDTTRARANILREMLTRPVAKNPFDSEAAKQTLDLCLSCKGCKSECPSNVDMAKLKAEFIYQYYKSNRRPVGDFIFANFHKFMSAGMRFPDLFNFMITNKTVSGWVKWMAGIAEDRSVPLLDDVSLKSWYARNRRRLKNKAETAGRKKTVYFFCDEMINYSLGETRIGAKAIELLAGLGYEVDMPLHDVSGRTYLSKGFLMRAKEAAVKNVRLFSGIVNEGSPLIGVEPSAILTFRDEYPDLVDSGLKPAAKQLAGHTFLIDEFLASEVEKGAITGNQFTAGLRKILLHGHCHQKTLSSMSATQRILELPGGYQVLQIQAGCCGMAGAFGYEKEHYDVSMKIGELALFPAIRSADPDTLIVATGSSCRHQIKDGVGRRALHPVEVLYDALASK